MNETMNCKGCGDDKPVSEMFVRGGKPIRTCKVCQSEHMRGGKNRIAKLAAKVAKKTAKRAVAEKGLPLPPAAPRIAIDPSFGVEGEIDDKGYLQLAQRDVEGNIVDRIALSRADLRQVIQAFQPWAA
jgi:hypothetical protein